MQFIDLQRLYFPGPRMSRVPRSGLRLFPGFMSRVFDRCGGILLRGGAVAARQTHNLQVVGSNPAPVTSLRRAAPPWHAIFFYWLVLLAAGALVGFCLAVQA